MAPPLRMTQQYRFASLAAWLSSTGISPVNSSLTSPQSISAVNSSPRPGIAQSPNSSSQPLRLAGDLHSCLACGWLQHRLSGSQSIQATTDQLSHSQP